MKRPLTIKLAAAFLLLLSLLVGGFAAARQFGLLGGLSGGMVIRGGMPGSFQGRTPGQMPGFQQGGGSGEFQRPEGTFTPPDGFDPATRPQRAFRDGGGLRTSFGVFGFLGIYQNWVSIGLGVIGLLAAYLLWKPSRWGIILAALVSLAVLVLNGPQLLALPVVFTFPALAWTMVPALAAVLLAVVVLVLALLPASRAAAFRKVEAAEEDEPEDRVVL